MASAEEALKARLDGFAPLATLIGTRTWAVKLPQNPVLPAVVLTRISTDRRECMGASSGVVQARFQLSTKAETVAAGEAVRVQLRAALNRWRGTSAGVVVQDVFLENELELWDEAALVHDLTLDVLAFYEE